ncbi:MAG: thiol:disulfide interchange protein DsbA/DsbL [Halothiobacillaceae bacterium]|jgi:thiol:disulfide interchange protein DsbA|nr:thiol:disulfide interchange protein DsbA/DsbL [Halothiobacillaceae bacterium]MDY0049945.1 thiol:disulfide interchange protein DsbA/DsbL [Halothiobacillaceae bacterium]
MARSDRRSFLLGSLALAAAPWLPARAEDLLFAEGIHYQRVQTPEPPTQGRVVEEFFSYHCPHCLHFEPLLKPWVKALPSDVKFRRTPFPLSESGIPLVRAYFALETMGRIEALHERIFEAVQIKRMPLNTREAIAGFLSSIGEDRDAFLKAYDSFGADSQTRRTITRAMTLGVDSVPAMIVQGTWLTTGTLAGGSQAAMLKVADQLLDTRALAQK